MSRFFDSEVVRESIKELDEIQKTLFEQVMNLSFYDTSGKKEHLDLMKQFLEKQKLFIFRLSLSDDPEAVELKERILDSAQLFGLSKNGTVDEFFKILESQIEYLEKTLDD
jgi:predicted transcriptional regulator